MIKFNFSLAPIEYDSKQIHHFLNPDEEDWDWSKYIKNCYPKLNKGDSKQKIHEFVIGFGEKHKKDLQNKLKNYKKEFEKIAYKIVSEFKKILELDAIKLNKTNILISLSPINPYDLEKKEFSVYWNFLIKDMIAISIHELFHLLYFEKWKEIFPKTEIKDFKPPSLIWHLSELIVPIILNDKKIQEIFEYNHRSYEEYNKLKINNESINEIILNLYKNRKDFSSFIKEAYKIMIAHEKEIQRV